MLSLVHDGRPKLSWQLYIISGNSGGWKKGLSGRGEDIHFLFEVKDIGLPSDPTTHIYTFFTMYICMVQQELHLLSLI